MDQTRNLGVSCYVYIVIAWLANVIRYSTILLRAVADPPLSLPVFRFFSTSAYAFSSYIRVNKTKLIDTTQKQRAILLLFYMFAERWKRTENSHQRKSRHSQSDTPWPRPHACIQPGNYFINTFSYFPGFFYPPKCRKNKSHRLL